MKKIFVMTLVALLPIGMVYFLPVASATAHASTSVSHSVAKSAIVTGPRTNPTFLVIYSPASGNTCFANNGYMGFRITNATFLHTGSNGGWVMCYGGTSSDSGITCASAGTKLYFDAYREYNLNNTLITSVDIDHQSGS